MDDPDDAIDISVLSYERTGYLEAMLDALAANTRWPHRITIVDNASSPAHRQWLRARESRVHRIVYNPVNEHLAAHQHGIDATSSELFVVTDADLVVPAPGDDGRCWLTRLVAQMRAHEDYALIGARLDTVTPSRNAAIEATPAVDGVREVPTGVWLNLMRRSALPMRYESDGIMCYALRRSGWRVGVADDVVVHHLGDADDVDHPAYLIAKHRTSALGVTYPVYHEQIVRVRAPADPEQLRMATSPLSALDARGVERTGIVEFGSGALTAADPSVTLVSRTENGHGLRADPAPIEDAGAVAAVVTDPALLYQGALAAERWLVLVVADGVVPVVPDWQLVDELPGSAWVSPGADLAAALVAYGAHAGWPAPDRTLVYAPVSPREPAERVVRPWAAALERPRVSRAPIAPVRDLATKALRLLAAERGLRRRG